ncbi:helix-turn-helix transcriptional regulator [Conexibacter sp. CPCC 206217]|uniref:helix-turn-helix transcriptional regulator n=1 Tax=Conexibacter sp. CPCC 206217 TaxID=3064574 RepID=UPI002728F881|nr:helix-turn-helix transcriptional regulator [Conexibacter sp. CPCC 206217]MDO8210375.1 helix-turn-helix transcriptional regulator [Conexibacter sp. CPCC 206217]
MPDDNRLGAFLRARRELVTPEQAGVTAYGRRRVPGLRREELAMLAGVSAAYYVRLEQGRDRHPSEQVIDALARVLQLDDDALEHLRALAAPTTRRRRSASARPERVRPELARLVAAQPTPATVLSRHMDVLAANALASALHPSYRAGRNIVRDVFLDAGARAQYVDVPRRCASSVASLRAAVGADLDDPRLTELVGELSLKSDEFRRLWARHDVHEKSGGSKSYDHPQLGELTLAYQSFNVPGTAGQLLLIYTAPPDSAAEQSLALLVTIAAEERGVSISSAPR